VPQSRSMRSGWTVRKRFCARAAASSSTATLQGYLDTWFNNGYAGAWPWSYKAVDANGAPAPSVMTSWASAHASVVNIAPVVGSLAATGGANPTSGQPRRMLDKLTHFDFAPLVTERFRLDEGVVTLELELVGAEAASSSSIQVARRTPFSLTFRGPRARPPSRMPRGHARTPRDPRSAGGGGACVRRGLRRARGKWGR